MERFKPRHRTLLTHHRKCEEQFENAQAKKDLSPSSGEHTPLKGRRGDEPDKACYPPSTPSPSREEEMLTEESLVSSHSGSDVDYSSSSSSSSSSEDEVLEQESQSSCHSSPEKLHHHLSSSDTEIDYFTSTFQDGEVPHSAVARSFAKRQWQTERRRHDEDDSGADEDDGSDNASQGTENTVGELQQDTNRGPQKMTTAKEKHDDDDDSNGKPGPGTENTDAVVHQETGRRPPVQQKERTTEKHDDDDRQEPHSTSGSSAVDKPKRIATTRQGDGDDEDSSDPEHDGEDRQTTATGSPQKGQKKMAVTRECSNIDDPEMKVKKQGKRPWNGQERTAVRRHLGKFIALQKVPAKQDCLMCIDKESSVLRARRWTDVKYFVYNEIVKVKRKLAL